MSFVKYASCEILDKRFSPVRITDGESFEKLAKASEISEDGYLYLRVRAISSRVNKNNDGWPSQELAKAFKTFEGKPIFVDHHNDDPERTRGVVLWSKLHVEDEKVSAHDQYYANAPEEHLPPTWIELLLEIDAKEFPKLAKAIISGDIDSVSMGANVERTVCSVCKNEATSPSEYCSHIQQKGAEFIVESSDGKKVSKKAYEDCYDISFFEISNVFDPADETALHLTIESNDKQSSSIYDEKEEEDFRDVTTLLDNKNNDEEEEESGYPPEVLWREEQYLKMGFPPEQAFDLALNPFIDWHSMKRLIEMGATLDQAVRILSKNSSLQKGAPYPGHHDENKKGDKVHIKGAPDKVNEIYHALRRDHPEYSKEKAARIAWSKYKLLLKKKKQSSDQDGDDDLREPRGPRSEQTTAPQKVDTLRGDRVCPRCLSDLKETADGIFLCEECGYELPPEEFDNPDLEQAKKIDTELRKDQQRTDKRIDPIKPIRPISPNTVSRNIPITFTAGLTSATLNSIKKSGIPVRITFQDGTTFSYPFTNKGEIFKKQSEFSNDDGELGHVIVTVDAPDMSSLKKAINIIQNGGNYYPHTTKNLLSNRVINEMEWVIESRAIRKDKRTSKNRSKILEFLNKADALGKLSHYEDENKIVFAMNKNGIKVTRKEAAEAFESYLSKKKVLLDKKKDNATDEPVGVKIVKDQLAPVESRKKRISDRRVIKRVERDGDIERTEEITEEFGETLPPSDQEKVDHRYDQVSTVSDENKQSVESSEKKIFASLKLAKLASQIGLIKPDDELAFAANAENEDLTQILARIDMLQRVKDAGLIKNKKTASVIKLPSFNGTVSSNSNLDDIDDSLLFL